MTSDFDYKKYSLEKLQDWVHDALSTGEASPHEIYSAIREAVREDYYYYKHHCSRASGLLELLSGHRPVKDTKWDEWEQTHYPEEVKDDGMRPCGHSDLEYQIANNKKGTFVGWNYTATGEKVSEQPSKNGVSNLEYTKAKIEANSAWNDGFTREYYQKIVDKYEGKQDKVKKWVLPVEEVQCAETGKDEYFVSFPDDLLEAANLKEGDQVEWIDQGDGSYLLKKVEKPMTYEEAYAAGWTMTDDGIWWPPQNTETVKMDEC
jgi:bifunctional DNA-binding transcriptional regulator/antitoxin component of YhaV-PrlF toxin-antitoxin module